MGGDKCARDFGSRVSGAEFLDARDFSRLFIRLQQLEISDRLL